MCVMGQLSNNAMCAKPGGFVIAREPEDSADKLTKTVVDGLQRLVYDPRHCRCGLSQLMGHQPKMPCGPISPAHVLEHHPNDLPEDLAGRGLLIKRVANGFFLGHAHRLSQDLGIQLQLVSEMIVHRCDIRPCTGTNLADGGGLVTNSGKNFSSCFE